ncbi:hypothetical protein VTN00DRAFT_278 [Thermoascus crustaceus]|uniref:uncharacterized protein n=1 Tax=Thermoascus crustaceus TaxID=5088 RepID=UPI003743036E
MQLISLFLGASLLSVSVARALPVSFPGIHPRTASTTSTDVITTLTNVADDTSIAGTNTSEKAAAIVSKLNEIASTKTATVSSVESAFSIIKDIFSDGPVDITEAALDIVSARLIPSDIFNFLNGYLDSDLNSDSNVNSRSPEKPIYPYISPDDAPYSVDEDSLRAAIHIPDSFSYGADGKKPVILVPGTAARAGTTYHFSFSKLGKAAANVDPVWVNIPSASLDDAQVNSEYVAYAINYISGISSSKVSVISWSQGGLNTQWALKYWPSTRAVVEDFIPISPDFHGTTLAALLCPGLSTVGCTPSIWQQKYDSAFISTIRADGGDSAYVPTTTLYSSLDEVVQPMDGNSASAYLSDTRGVGVTNNQVQTICPGKPAGGAYTHEGMLYNPLSWALAIDAINHDGPGDPSRLNLDEVCGQLIPPQLELDDVLGTEGLIVVAPAEVLGYGSPASGEPPIKRYAK